MFYCRWNRKIFKLIRFRKWLLSVAQFGIWRFTFFYYTSFRVICTPTKPRSHTFNIHPDEITGRPIERNPYPYTFDGHLRTFEYPLLHFVHNFIHSTLALIQRIPISILKVVSSAYYININSYTNFRMSSPNQCHQLTRSIFTL